MYKRFERSLHKTWSSAWHYFNCILLKGATRQNKRLLTWKPLENILTNINFIKIICRCHWINSLIFILFVSFFFVSSLGNLSKDCHHHRLIVNCSRVGFFHAVSSFTQSRWREITFKDESTVDCCCCCRWNGLDILFFHLPSMYFP